MAQGNATVSFERITGGVGIGVNNAPVSATFHLPPERVETPPSPSSTVPFLRDPDYVDRPTLRDEISTKLSAPGARVALVGLGGTGKTQLAVECARRIREQSPNTWVLWIHAATEARFEQSVRDIADEAKIYGRREPKANIFELFRNWLRDSNKGRWLLVLDNVDNAEFLLSSPPSGDNGRPRRLMDYLPACEHGSVLVTTRSRSEAQRLVHRSQVVEILPMEHEYAEALLKKKLGPSKGQDRKRLAAALDYLPLAMAQAAAYICERGPRCSVEQYIKELEHSRELRTSLLRRDEEFPDRKYDEASSSILATWQISFEHIVRTRQSAADLLSLMSFCDRQSIPESLLRDSSMAPESGETATLLNNQFEEDVRTLRNFSFISATADRSCWEMHRLVQDATRMWLDDRSDSNNFQARFLARLDRALPSGGYKNWTTWQNLFPHVQCAVENEPPSGDALSKWASIMYNAAGYALLKGQWKDAESMAMSSMRARGSMFGETDNRTMDSAAMLGQILRVLGSWDRAEVLQVKLMEESQATLGADHPDTLTSMANLASTYWSQGRWKEAEKLEVKVMVESQARLGPEHSNTLNSMANLATTYRSQGRWGEAEQIEVQLLSLDRAKLGLVHPDTLSSMANLASTYGNQGRWGEAEQLQLQVMKARKSTLETDHPETLRSVANLATTYWNQGRWREAEELEIQVLDVRKSKLGLEHPDTLSSMANLASTYRLQGRESQAEQIGAQVLEIRTRKLGPEHPDTLSSMASLATTYGGQGRWEEAERLKVQVLQMQSAKLGRYHPDTLNSKASLATTYRKQGRWAKAEELQMEVMVWRQANLGNDHPDTLTSMASLALTYQDQGRLMEANQLEMSALETRRAKLGLEHPDTLTSMNDLASTYFKQGHWKDAEQIFIQVLQTRKAKLGLQNNDTLTSMNNLASTFFKQERWDEAEKLFLHVLETRRATLGNSNPDTLSSMTNLASTFRRQDRRTEAEDLQKEAVSGMIESMGRDHPDTVSAIARLT